MTKRKPPGVRFESWIEKQIREGMERGEFDSLPGTGRPLADLDQPHDDDWWLREKLRREELSYLPPTLVLRKEAEDALAAARRAPTDAEARRIIEEINERIRVANRTPMVGPPLNLMPFDVDAVVAVRRPTERS